MVLFILLIRIVVNEMIDHVTDDSEEAWIRVGEGAQQDQLLFGCQNVEIGNSIHKSLSINLFLQVLFGKSGDASESVAIIVHTSRDGYSTGG